MPPFGFENAGGWRPVGTPSESGKVERGTRAAVAQWATRQPGVVISDNLWTEVVTLPTLGFTQFQITMNNDPIGQPSGTTAQPNILYYRICEINVARRRTMLYGPIPAYYGGVSHDFTASLTSISIHARMSVPKATNLLQSNFYCEITVLS